jgi:hypothetical protein
MDHLPLDLGVENGEGGSHGARLSEYVLQIAGLVSAESMGASLEQTAWDSYYEIHNIPPALLDSDTVHLDAFLI